MCRIVYLAAERKRRGMDGPRQGAPGRPNKTGRGRNFESIGQVSARLIERLR